MPQLNYPDTATFVKVTADGYSNNKIMLSQDCVPVVFLQNTGFLRQNQQDNVDADAICYPDHNDPFIVASHNRLEGYYILAPLFDASEDDGWYKVVQVLVNRDHLLGNEIDNIQLILKKTEKVPGVS